MKKSINTSFGLVLFLILFGFVEINAQDQFREVIIQQAKLVSESVINEDYESLINYTHPNIVEKVGGREVLVEAVKSSMESMKAEGIKIESIEIDDTIIISKFKDEYHCLVPKILKMSIGENKIISKSYLFGFSDLNGEHWTFTEADKLISEEGSQFFPNFETNIHIPTKPMPMYVESFW